MVGNSSPAPSLWLRFPETYLHQTAGASRGQIILDFDATPIDVHSEKERTAVHNNGGFGFNPLVASCAREVLSGTLRPGNAGANNVEDHFRVLDLALEQLPLSALKGGDARPI